MMRRRLDQTVFRCAAVSCACGALAAVSGCAMMGHMRPAADSYTFDVGVASAPDIHSKASDLFRRFGYTIARDDESKPGMETEWQKRAPADEEERTRGYEIISMPPPSSGGVALAQLLGIKEDRAADFKGVAHNSAQYIHLLDLDGRGQMVRRRIFADMSSDETDGVPDGMKVDVEGRVYCTGPGGTWVFAPDGRRLGIIRTPEVPANLAFGGPDLRTLFFTARTSVYAMRVKAPGQPHPWYEKRRARA